LEQLYHRDPMAELLGHINKLPHVADPLLDLYSSHNCLSSRKLQVFVITTRSPIHKITILPRVCALSVRCERSWASIIVLTLSVDSGVILSW